MHEQDATRPGEVPPLPAWAVWLGASGWWLADALSSVSQVQLLQRIGEAEVSQGELWRMSLASSLLWVPITVMCLRLAERVPLTRARLRSTLGCHAGALALVVLGRAVFVVLTQDLIGWYGQLPHLREILAQSVVNNLLPYILLTAGAHALGLARRAQVRQRRADPLQTQLAEARLQALASQLRPHFLFNALNAVATLVHSEPDAAERMLARLGDLLRHSLDSHGRQEVTLREELEALAPYLDIERTRFGPRLEVDWKLAPEVMDARVPFLALQPPGGERHPAWPRTARGARPD